MDPGEAGLSFESWTLDRPDGAKIPVWEIKGRTHAHGNPALTAVFVHDWMASRIDDLATLDTWPDLVERIVLYDRRGHGEATGRSRLGGGESDDLHALLDRLGEGPVVLVARGAGAAIAGAALPAEVTGLVIEGPQETYQARLTAQLQAARCPRMLAPLATAAIRLTGIRPADPAMNGRVDSRVAVRGDEPLDGFVRRLRV